MQDFDLLYRIEYALLLRLKNIMINVLYIECYLMTAKRTYLSDTL